MLLHLWACPCSSLKLLSLRFAPSCKSQMLAFPLSISVAAFHPWSILGGLDRGALYPKLWDPCDPSERGDVMGNVGSPSGSAFRRDQMNIH